LLKDDINSSEEVRLIDHIPLIARGQSPTCVVPCAPGIHELAQRLSIAGRFGTCPYCGTVGHDSERMETWPQSIISPESCEPPHVWQTGQEPASLRLFSSLSADPPLPGKVKTCNVLLCSPTLTFRVYYSRVILRMLTWAS